MQVYPSTRQLTKIFTILSEKEDGLNIKNICLSTFINRRLVEQCLRFYIMIGKVKKVYTNRRNLYKWLK